MDMGRFDRSDGDALCSYVSLFLVGPDCSFEACEAESFSRFRVAIRQSTGDRSGLQKAESWQSPVECT